MTDPYRIRSPEVWVQARDDYIAGMDAEAVCRRYDLGLSAFRRRARQYGWRRRDLDDPVPNGVNLSIYEDIDHDDQVEMARLRFIEALSRGRAIEALRWRKLWIQIRDTCDAMNADLFAEMSPEDIEEYLTAQPDDETDEEVRLLSMPTGEPETGDPVPVEKVHDVHSIFSGVHIREGDRPSKRATRRLRGRMRGRGGDP